MRSIPSRFEEQYSELQSTRSAQRDGRKSDETLGNVVRKVLKLGKRNREIAVLSGGIAIHFVPSLS